MRSMFGMKVRTGIIYRATGSALATRFQADLAEGLLDAEPATKRLRNTPPFSRSQHLQDFRKYFYLPSSLSLAAFFPSQKTPLPVPPALPLAVFLKPKEDSPRRD
jgi:hypothetical protein